MANLYFIECGEDGGRLFSGEEAIAKKTIADFEESGFEVVCISERFHWHLSQKYLNHELNPDGTAHENHYLKRESYIQDLAFVLDGDYCAN